MIEISIQEEEPKEIKAVSDSAAYLEAFKTFTISSKVSRDMIETYGTMNSSPVKFLLLNDKAQDISKTVYFIDKSLREKEIIDQFYSMGNMVKANYDSANEEKTKQFQLRSLIFF